MLQQAYGAEYASRVWIKTQIVVVNDFIGVKEKMNDIQLNTLCDQILVEYGGLNLLEFALFCSRLRSGKYESFYGSVDPMRIMQSLEDFMEDRRRDINKAVEVEEKIRKEKELKEHRKTAITYEQYRQSLIDDGISDEELAQVDKIFGKPKEDEKWKK